MKLLPLLLLFSAACSGSIPNIPLPSSGSVTVTDAGVTVCTTVPLAAIAGSDAGAR